MVWLYKNEKIQDIPEKVVGFVYEITNITSGRKYIGKKLAKFKRSRPPLKGRRNKRRYLVNSDWQDYYGSSDELTADVLKLGKENFTNHIIWNYSTGGVSKEHFARKHDDILFYARGSRWWFDPPMVPATSNRMAGKMKKATDVIEIASINNMAKERVGWPTQKPIELLKLLVGACCPPGGKVLDPFCGSGTTLMAAHALGRNSVGIDRDTEAIRLTRERAEILSGS